MQEIQELEHTRVLRIVCEVDAQLIKLEDTDSEIVTQENKDINCENKAGGVHFVLIHELCMEHGAGIRLWSFQRKMVTRCQQ